MNIPVQGIGGGSYFQQGGQSPCGVTPGCAVSSVSIWLLMELSMEKQRPI